MRQIKNKTSPTLIDITCDICGKSCKDRADMNYEMVCLQGSWGYMSRKDGTNWCCDICEDCADRVKEFIESIGAKVREESYI